MKQEKSYSFIKRNNLVLGFSFLILLIFLSISLLCLTQSQVDKQNELLVEEQVELIVNTLDKYSLKDQYDYISKTLFRLKLVDEVALFGLDCEIKAALPINRNYPKYCGKHKLEKGFFYKVENSFKSSGVAYIWIKLNKENTKVLKDNTVIYFLIIMFLFLIALGIVFFVNKIFILTPLNRLISSIRSFSRTNNMVIPRDIPFEVKSVYDAFLDKNTELEESRTLIEKAKERELLAQTAEQVAHDIKSPVSALELILDRLASDNKEYLAMGKTALDDIQLLISKIGDFDQSIDKDLELSNLGENLKKIIKQKKVEYEKASNLKINFVDNSVTPLKAMINHIEFNTVISNIVNNSVNALQNNGIIEITLDHTKRDILIKIKDNGRGIAKKDLNKVFLKGVSIDKKEGKGLGLNHALEKVLEWKGEIDIRSVESSWTEVIVKLPKVKIFQSSEMAVDHKTEIKEIYLLDDERYFLEVFKGSLMDLPVEIKAFSNEVDLLQDIGEIASDKIFILDLENKDNRNLGIEIAENLSVKGATKICLLSGHDQKYLISTYGDRLKVFSKIFLKTEMSQVKNEIKLLLQN